MLARMLLIAAITTLIAGCSPYPGQENIYHGASYTCTEVKLKLHDRNHSPARRARLITEYNKYGCSELEDNQPIAW